jgi:hypothetical protein
VKNEKQNELAHCTTRDNARRVHPDSRHIGRADNGKPSAADALLNPDGTLNISTGVRGAIDLRGWNVTLDTMRGPVFEPSDRALLLPGTVDWSPLNTGVNGAVQAVAISGTDVYVGGYFTTAGTCIIGCNYIAKWDGTTWSPLGTGMSGFPSAAVNAIAISGTDVYAGGWFTSAGTCTSGCNRIAKWDGASWSPLGTGMNETVYAIAISGTNVYAGGHFTSAGTCNSAAGCNRIAKWDGSSWSPLGSGMSSRVNAIAISGTDVYAGGEFYSAGTCVIGCDYIAKWNGSSWSPLGTGMNNYVHALAISGTDVYAGGEFNSAGACTSGCYRIAKWDGSSWSPLGTGMGFHVLALAISGTDVYAGGWFTNASTCDSAAGCKYIAKWDGSTWSPLGTGMNSVVQALAINSAGVYAGGQFTSAGTCNSASGCNAIARYGGLTESARITGPGTYTIYIGDRPVVINVNTQGTLARINITRFNTSHPNATGNYATGVYWQIEGLDGSNNTATGFNVTLTLPHANKTNPKACRYVGGWACAASAFTSSTVTRPGVTAFSDWTVGEDVPTNVTLSNFNAQPQPFDLVAWFKQMLGLAR